MADDLLYEKNGAIATITLNRPEARNALSVDMREQLFQSVIDAESDESIRCVVVRGAGEHFQAGGDVKSFNEFVKLSPKEREQTFERRIHGLHPTIFAMQRMPKPIIASVRGGAAGFGLSLMMACDMVIASSRSPISVLARRRTDRAHIPCRALSVSRRRWRLLCSATGSRRRRPRTSA